jgi:hypothetical protein
MAAKRGECARLALALSKSARRAAPQIVVPVFAVPCEMLIDGEPFAKRPVGNLLDTAAGDGRLKIDRNADGSAHRF